MTEKTSANQITILDFLVKVSEYLEELSDLNSKLLDVLKAYQRHLVSCETDTIEKSTPGLDRFAGEIRLLDERRRAFVDDFFISHGWTGSRNYSGISDHIRRHGVSDDEAAAFERVSQARMKLIRILAEVDAQNSLNITLISQGMSFAEVSLKALLGFDSNPLTYGPDDMGEDGPSILDAQA
jgi:hypothetical protein